MSFSKVDWENKNIGAYCICYELKVLESTL
jgi:hypothetical protein